jgi:CDP-diacylglycerol--glycerol-3-phosphate 3-phosphatidyltransferase
MIVSKPNIITFFRLAVAPVFYFMLMSLNPIFVQLSCLLFLFGALSDMIDGWVARRYKEVTSFGRFFDPLADKFLTTAAFIAFAKMQIIPVWMIIVVIIRDFGVTFLRLAAERAGKKIITSITAKIKTSLQMIFISIILAFIFIGHSQPFIKYQSRISDMLHSDYVYGVMLLLTIITLLTFIEYLYKNLVIFKAINNE